MGHFLSGVLDFLPSGVDTGGVSKNKGVAQAIERRLGAELRISEQAQLNGALGAALFALELDQ